MTFILLLLAAVGPIDSLYNSGSYEAVVEQAPLLLAGPGLNSVESVHVNVLYASALVALGRSDEASAVFRRLVQSQIASHQPPMTLDPERFSPKIRSVFDQAKAEVLLAPNPPVTTDTVYIGKRAPLSALVFGLGQIQNREPVKGWALLGAGVLAVAGTGLSQLMYNSARTEYLAASDPNEIDARYQDANNWYRARTITAGSALGIWLYSLVDALSGP
jgi:hypothetical protein